MGSTPLTPQATDPALDALMPSTRQKVLGLLFASPDRSFYTNEIIERVGAGSGAVLRELERLAAAGLLEVSRIGNQKHYRANPASPLFPELSSLLRKTIGLATPLRNALEPLRGKLDLAAVYGSIARGEAGAGSDVDLLVVSDDLSLEAVFAAVTPVEERLGRRINPTLLTRSEFLERRSRPDGFLRRVLDGELVLLMGELPE